MNSNFRSQEHNALWSKYCGVIDDYDTLKNKWQFLRYELSPALPDLDPVFTRVDELVKTLQTLLNPSGDRRLAIAEANEQEQNYDRNHDIEEIFDELKEYIAMLKTAFIQRTMCFEIMQIPFCITQTPERTIGKELFYVAVDNLVRSYYNSLELGDKMWDGVVTFMPPYESSHARVFISRKMRLFHVCFSDELKYFFPSLILSSHELCHVLAKFRSPLIGRLYNKALAAQQEELAKFKAFKWKTIAMCKGCPVNPTRKSDWSKEIFKELIIDILALKISGPNYVQSLLDLFLWPDMERNVFMRTAGLNSFLHSSGRYKKHLVECATRLERYILLSKTAKDPVPSECFRCWMMQGGSWGNFLYVRDKEDRMLSSLVKSEFGISKTQEKELEKLLREGLKAKSVDPRLLIHAHHELVKKGEFSNFYSLYYNLSSVFSNELKQVKN